MMNVALVGCGFMGRMHGEVYGVLSGAQLVATCDKDPDAAAKVAQAHKAKTESFAKILADSTIDVVDICLPTYLHAEFTVAALQAGKHVFCEKPMAITLAEADRMIEAQKASGKSLMIGHCIRFWSEYAILKKLTEDRSLGDLLSINLTRYGAFPSWSSDGWLGKEELSGGGALDMHIHDTDYALYLLGKPDSIDSWATIDHRGPSQIFTTMRFGKAIAHLEGGWNLPSTAPFKMSFRAIFERGLAIMDAGPLTIYEDDKEPVVPEVPKMAAKAGGNISDLGGYFFELDYFYKGLEAGTPLLIVTPETSRDSLAATLKEISIAKAKN